MARSGKIARLPDGIRDEINQRIHDGQTGSEILDWANALDEVRARMAELYGGAEISDANLSNWRAGGYQDWLDKVEETENVKELSDYLVKVAGDGRDIFDGAAAIAGGKIYKILSGFDIDQIGEMLAEKPEKFTSFVSALVSLQGGATETGKLELARQKLATERERLEHDKEKLELTTVSKFMQWAKTDEAQNILNSGEPKTVQMDLLRKMMFGERPDFGDQEGMI